MAIAVAEPEIERRLDHVIWMLVAASAVTVLAAPMLSAFYIDWPTFAAPVAASLALAFGAWFYRTRRPDIRLEAGLSGTAQLIAFAAVGAPVSYLATAAGTALPLQDPALDAIDRALGFDWLAMLRFLNDAPATFATLRLAYGSLLPQMVLAVLCLAFTGRTLWLRTIMLAFVLTTLATIALSTLVPAAGVWLHYGLTGADARTIPIVSTVWPVFTGLRDGSLRALVAAGAEGVITFPSLHAGLAALMTMALWPLPRWRWPSLTLNAAMLVATPVDGAHYLIDILAGLALAALCLALAHGVSRFLRRVPSAPAAATVAIAATHS